MQSDMYLDALFAAKPVPFGPRGAPSSIQKQPVNRLTVNMNGTDEDEQGNKKLHGGPEKVLHQYSYTGYQHLRAAYPQKTFSIGTIGENLIVAGMDDGNVYIGDIYKMGNVVLQVSAPRAPCNKISHRYEIKNLDRYVGLNGVTGWYYRVIETGVLHVGDPVVLLSRPQHSVSIAALMTAVYDKGLPEQAREYVSLDVLDDEWREKCQRVINRAS